MERKLSQKATKMRQRLTFGRTDRTRASTMNSSTASISVPGSRPRSATTPPSSESNPAEESWVDKNDVRCYNFIDEPGFFRPSSPLINRQELDEDLEDEVKHSCTLLVQSIDRGLPIWPCLEASAGAGSLSTSTGLAQPSPETRMKFQGRHLSPARMDYDIPVHKAEHDSGVAFSNQSSRFYGRTGSSHGNQKFASASNPPASGGNAAATGRFYGTRLSTSPREQEEFNRGRSRGRSFATETASPRSRSRTPSVSRSRSPSPAIFPYSPPQADAIWAHENNELKPTIQSLTERDTSLGAEGMAWLRASVHIPSQPTRDIQTSYSNPPTQQQPTTSHLAPATAAPRRFYSTRQAPKKKLTNWSAYEVTSSRSSSICGSISVHSFSSFDADEDENVEKSYHGFYQLAADPAGNSNPIAVPRNKETIHSIGLSPDDGQPRHKRKRASHLLKKLAGLGMRKREHSLEGRRMHTAVAAIA